MDIVGALGYSGQTIAYFDNGLLAYVTGKSVCIVDVTVGPRELIWRFETGVKKIISNSVSQRFAIVPSVPFAPIEIISLSSMKVVATIPNPTQGVLLDANFNRSGDLLVAVSDSLDRNVFIYDISRGRSLIVLNLGKNYSFCSFNPVDDNQIFLYGASGVASGVLHDLLDCHVLKLTEHVFQASNNSNSQTISFSEKEYLVTCAIWLPQNRVLFATASGHIIEVDVANDKFKVIGFVQLEGYPDDFRPVPKSMLLTVDSLVVGLSTGHLVWLPLECLFTQDAWSSALVPVQISSLKGCISSLVEEMSTRMLFVSTDLGLLFRFNVEMQAKHRVGVEGEEDLGPDGEPAVVDTSVITVVGEKVCLFQEGAVLCCAAVSVPIIGTSTNKITKKTTHLLNMLVTGSHIGRLSFWKQPEADAEALPLLDDPLGVRRSVPKAMKLLSAHEIPGASPPVVISQLPTFIRDGTCAVGVGTSSGSLEVYKFDAMEVEDEDEEGENTLVEGIDEDGMKLSVWPVASYRVYERSLTSICRASDWDERGASHLVAVASLFDPRIYILKLDERDVFSISLQICIDTTVGPSSMSWSGSNLYVSSYSGCIQTYSNKILLAATLESDSQSIATTTPDVTFQTPYSEVVSSAFLYQEKEESLLLLTNEPSVVCLEYLGPTSLVSVPPSEDGNESMISIEDGESSFLPVAVDPFRENMSFGSIVHSDVVVCVAVSPSDRLIATGSVSGSVYLWTLVKTGAGNHFKCVSLAHLHDAAVISLTFSSDASMVLSCGADGSSFVTCVDRPAHIEYEFETSRHSVRARKFQHALGPVVSVPADSTRLWIDDRKDEVVSNLKVAFESKVAELSENVSGLAARLRVLLEKNSARGELERMARAEFVVDVPLRDEIVEENQRNVAKIVDTYRLRGFWNELHAARIRSACWDTMATSARSILPFCPEACGDVKSVSAFSIPRASDAEQLTLQKVKRLRAIEIRSQRAHQSGLVQRLPNEGKIRSCWASAVQGTSSQINWISGDGSAWPTAEVSTILIQKDAEAKAAETNKKEAAAAADPGGDDEMSLNSQDNIADLDENDVFNLLYSPQCLRTDVQKRMHIILLKEVVRLIKSRFNEHFEKLALEKEATVGNIESKNARIFAILEELHQSDDYFKPVVADVEKSGSAIVVYDQEIVNRPFETESMRAARLREEEEARRREAADDKKEAFTRALNDMMHGTLEVKRNVFEEANSLARPAWMDEIAEADMTEAQLKEYDAFNAKFKALQEEQTLYRKQLEQEIKKLKTEVSELTKAFDEKLVSLSRIRVLTLRSVLTHELFVTRLGNSILRIEQSWSQLRSIDSAIDRAKKERKDLQVKMERFAVHCEETKVALNAAQDEERQLDKSFKRDIQALCGVTFDQDTLKTLTTLFRIRTYPRDDSDEGFELAEQNNPDQSEGGDQKGSKRGSQQLSKGSKQAKGQVGRRSLTHPSSNNNNNLASAQTASRRNVRHNASRGRGSQNASDVNGAMGPMQEAAQALQKGALSEGDNAAERDPFYSAIMRMEKVKKQQEAQIPLLTPLSMDYDCPEGFTIDNLQFTWSKLQELRTAKIEKEVEVKRLQIRYQELKVKLDAMHSDEAVINANITTLRTTKEDLLALLKGLQTDLDIVVLLKQGQDEVNADAIVTDYSDAMCIPATAVAKFNARIKELGRDKIGMLTKIKTFRRKINLVDWEAKHLAMECNHLEEYFTDLQLFRVTRELQQILREGSDAEQTKERLEKVALRKDFMQKDADLKLTKLRRLKESMRKQLSERTDEISSLERKVSDLKAQVAARRSVQQSKTEARNAGDIANETALKMKKIMARRHLVDTAKAQAEEIDFLRQELDKVRQKTFPSFIRAVKKRLPNPDERL